MSSYRVAVRACIAMVLVLLPAIGLAATEAVEAAEWAVRTAVRERLGRGHRIALEQSSERFLSLSEVVVTGSGHTYEGGEWDRDRTFEFSVKVKQDGSRTRDLSITFSDGAKHKGRAAWQDVTYDRDDVTITRPRWDERFASDAVPFEGRAKSEVSIRVLDSRNREVATGSARPFLGRFQTTLRVPQGRFRAILGARGDAGSHEVRFSVDDSEPSRDDVLTIDQPVRGATVDGPRVTFSGKSLAGAPRIQVWDSRNNVVRDRDVPIRGGRFWITQVVLDPGRYRFTASNGRARQTVEFTVVGDRAPGFGPRFRVDQPSDGATLKGPRVTVAGNSSASSVRVLVWDDRNNQVADRDVPTQRNYWNTQLSLDDGSYRVTVREQSGRGSDTRSFRVKGGDKPSGGLAVALRVQEPKRDGFVKGPRVTVSGNSSGRSVRVQIWDARNNRVAARDVPTRDGYWNTQVPLSGGRYRVRAEAEGRRDYEEFWFEVK